MIGYLVLLPLLASAAWGGGHDPILQTINLVPVKIANAETEANITKSTDTLIPDATSNNSALINTAVLEPEAPVTPAGFPDQPYTVTPTGTDAESARFNLTAAGTPEASIDSNQPATDVTESTNSKLDAEDVEASESVIAPVTTTNSQPEIDATPSTATEVAAAPVSPVAPVTADAATTDVDAPAVPNAAATASAVAVADDSSAPVMPTNSTVPGTVAVAPADTKVASSNAHSAILDFDFIGDACGVSESISDGFEWVVKAAGQYLFDVSNGEQALGLAKSCMARCSLETKVGDAPCTGVMFGKDGSCKLQYIALVKPAANIISLATASQPFGCYMRKTVPRFSVEGYSFVGNSACVSARTDPYTPISTEFNRAWAPMAIFSYCKRLCDGNSDCVGFTASETCKVYMGKMLDTVSTTEMTYMTAPFGCYKKLGHESLVEVEPIESTTAASAATSTSQATATTPATMVASATTTPVVPVVPVATDLSSNSVTVEAGANEAVPTITAQDVRESLTAPVAVAENQLADQAVEPVTTESVKLPETMDATVGEKLEVPAAPSTLNIPTSELSGIAEAAAEVAGVNPEAGVAGMKEAAATVKTTTANTTATTVAAATSEATAEVTVDAPAAFGAAEVASAQVANPAALINDTPVSISGIPSLPLGSNVAVPDLPRTADILTDEKLPEIEEKFDSVKIAAQPKPSPVYDASVEALVAGSKAPVPPVSVLSSI